jgi:hypothetical protein
MSAFKVYGNPLWNSASTQSLQKHKHKALDTLTSLRAKSKAELFAEFLEHRQQLDLNSSNPKNATKEQLVQWIITARYFARTGVAPTLGNWTVPTLRTHVVAALGMSTKDITLALKEKPRKPTWLLLALLAETQAHVAAKTGKTSCAFEIEKLKLFLATQFASCK